MKVARPDLVGEIFRMTRYGKHLVRKLNRANGAIGVWGNELFELKGKAQTFYISREHIPGSPPFMDGSYDKPPYRLRWEKRVPASVSDDLKLHPLEEIRSGPFELASVQRDRMQRARR